MRGFLTGAFALVLAAIGLRLWVSAHEWFIADDFYFLHWIRSPEWSWREVFLPTHARMIGVYRPLGLDAYYYLNFKLFGWNAFGYYLVGLLLHAATAGVTYRIARQLGFDPRAAVTAGALVLAADPGVTSTYCACVHNYLLAGLCYALSVSWTLDTLAGKRAALLGSCTALIIGLLCNDVCATLPAAVFGAALQSYGPALRREPWLRAAKAALPHAIIVALFVDFRIHGVPIPLRQDNWFYDVDFGPDMLSNTWGNLALIAGNGYRLGALLCALTLVFAWAWSRGASARATVRARLAHTWLPCTSWLLAALFPFAVLAFPHPRFALVLTTPAVLLLCALLDALLPLAHRPRVAAYGLLALVALALPWSAALEHARHPDGAVHRRSFELLKSALRGGGRAPERVDIAYDAPGLAGPAALDRFRWQTFGGALVLAVAPELPLEVEFRDLKAPPAGECSNCATFYLHEDLSLTAGPATR